MPNLCCILNKNPNVPVTCSGCDVKWCWCLWQEDRTHRSANHFGNCPKTGRHLKWQSGSHNLVPSDYEELS